MRIRTIKPEFWEDEVIGALSLGARLLFVATWNMADDEGLLRWTPEYVRATAFVYDESTNAKKLMTELVDAGLILPYAGGRTQQSLAWIPNFHKHQRINRPQPSKLPAPSLQNGSVVAAYVSRDGHACYLCNAPVEGHNANSYSNGGGGDSGPSLDHVIPRVSGGTDYPSNIRLAHGSCNRAKGTKSLSEFMRDSVNGSHLRSSSHELRRSALEGNGSGRGVERGTEGSGLEAAAPFVDTNPNQPLERQLYFGEKLDVSIPSIVKLNKAHGREFVLLAMEQLHGFPPEEPVENIYAYLDSVASFKKAGVA